MRHPLFSEPFTWEAQIPFERAQSRRAFADIAVDLFRETGDSLFTLGRLGFENRSPLADGEPEPTHPFADLSRPLVAAGLSEASGYRFLPLAPVARENEEEQHRRLADFLRGHPDECFAVGLSNIGHLSLVRELASLPKVVFFVDFHLYVANRFAFSLLSRHIPSLLFVYFWGEGEEGDFRKLDESLDNAPLLARVRAGFRPPLFYGMGWSHVHCIMRAGVARNAGIAWAASQSRSRK